MRERNGGLLNVTENDGLGEKARALGEIGNHQRELADRDVGSVKLQEAEYKASIVVDDSLESGG